MRLSFYILFHPNTSKVVHLFPKSKHSFSNSAVSGSGKISFSWTRYCSFEQKYDSFYLYSFRKNKEKAPIRIVEFLFRKTFFGSFGSTVIVITTESNFKSSSPVDYKVFLPCKSVCYVRPVFIRSIACINHASYVILTWKNILKTI